MATERRAGQGDARAAGVSRGAQARRIAAAVLVTLVLLFAVLNSQSVEVDWIVTTSETPQIVVMLLFAVAGFAIGWLLAWQRARRR
jgi:uncharacterized integral membrane protein